MKLADPVLIDDYNAAEERRAACGFVTESFAAAVAKVVQLHAHPVMEPLFASA